MLREMTAPQFYEWWAWYSIEPRGDERGDMQAAIVSKTVADVNRGKGRRPYDIDIFLPQYGKQEEPQTPEQQKHICMMIAAAYAARQKAKNKGK